MRSQAFVVGFHEGAEALDAVVVDGEAADDVEGIELVEELFVVGEEVAVVFWCRRKLGHDWDGACLRHGACVRALLRGASAGRAFHLRERGCGVVRDAARTGCGGCSPASVNCLELLGK